MEIYMKRKIVEIRRKAESFQEYRIRFVVIEECSDIESEVKKIKHDDYEINLIIINRGERWCHVVVLEKDLIYIIEKLSGKLAWKKDNIFCFYVYQSALKFSENIKKEGYLFASY